MKRIIKVAAVVLLAALAALPVQARDNEQFLKDVQETIDSVTPAFVFIGGGSGVLISPDGYFLTNQHVVGGVAEWRVTITDGRSFKATRIGVDGLGDICLLKIETDEKLPHVNFGDSDALQVGEYVFAVGNPFALGNAPTTEEMHPSISLGIVSALHRYQQTYSDAIQTDAAVNPGNSGGPLFNLKGELVGINGRIATRYGNRVNSGIGYAIPARQIQNFLPELKKRAGKTDQNVAHGSVRGMQLSRESTDGKGALIARVAEDGDAWKTGFRDGDLITEVDGYRIYNQARFLGVIGTYPARTVLPVTVLRDEKRVELDVELYPMRRDANWARRTIGRGGYLGIRVADPDEGQGAEVLLLEPLSPAETGGLIEGDIITGLGRFPVPSAEQFLQMMSRTSPGARVTFRLIRDGQEMQLNITLGEHDD